MSAPEPEQLYCCENCGLVGPMSEFQDDCRPGWTHGRLIRVSEVRNSRKECE